MPKIIKNVREQLLAEAKRQVSELGYAKTTMRSVAGACGLGVGTVYNYFPSKDVLVASFMLEDWQRELLNIENASKSDPCSVLRAIYDSLSSFISLYKSLFADAEAKRNFNSSHWEYHTVLRSQIAKMVFSVINKADNDDFICEFISESLLTWTVEGKSFEEIYSILKLIINT